MDLPIEDLIHRYLDDQLDPGQLARLNELLASDAKAAQQLVQIALLHDRLHDRLRPQAEVVESLYQGSPTRPRQWPRLDRRRLKLTLASAIGVALVATLILTRGLGNQPVGAAEATLGRLIEAQALAGDRTYRIVALESVPAGPEGDPARGRPRPTVDGARLHLRGDGQYVLVRRPGQPDEFVTGSDGQQAWSIPPDGPVRVSSNAARFRGALPGEQQGLPFLDLGSALERLREAYDLQLVDGPEAHLSASKRSALHRGPREVRVWFDPTSGVIRRLRLDGMPQAQGGPRSVVLELIDRRDLGHDFYAHDAHHAPDRRVIHETP